MDKLVVVKKNSKCNFCGITNNDCMKYGPMYKLGNITAHYYCVLLSNRLIQNGDDNEGILGFLLSDIEKELQRTSVVNCTYCKKGTATISCASKKCRRSFHLPCGIKQGSMHEFADQFKSFCHKHCPAQNIPPKILREACKTRVICCICYESVNPQNKKDNLWAPCCSKTWYHRTCVQKLAYSAGYFFRCATCNDVQKFNKWMQKFGIFVPQQDASWELVPNAFEDLLYRHDKCDAENCKCPDGRKKNEEKTIWEIILCESCGSQGIHVYCGSLKFVDPEWECPGCSTISLNLKKDTETRNSVKTDQGSSKHSKLVETSHKKRRRCSQDLKNSVLDKRKKSRTLVEDDEADEGDEIEIDVETVEECKPEQEPKDKENHIFSLNVKGEEDSEIQEVLGIIKPGPLSYKLSILQKIWEVPPPEKTTDDSDSVEVIELSDSDTEENKSEESSDVITLCEVIKEPDEDDEKNKDEVINKSSQSENVSFSFTLHSRKWAVDNQLYILNEIQSKSGFSEDLKCQNALQPDLFLPPPVAENSDRYQDELIPAQEWKLDKPKSDFIGEEDCRTGSDDDVILLTN